MNGRRLDRTTLARQALAKSIEIRQQADLGLERPIDVYALSCEHLRVPVRFLDISMEGMYRRTPSPYILLSALRPAPRKTFNCAHELGHHAFGHGSTIDALLEDAGFGDGQQSPGGGNDVRGSWRDPDEFLVDVFAGFLLMPSLGLRRAYTIRGLRPGEASPEQHFAIACAFGVGYTTLLNHLALSAKLLPEASVKTLSRTHGPNLRARIVGAAHAAPPVIVVDAHWELPTIDAEVGTHIFVPQDTDVTGSAVVRVAELPTGRLFRAARPGIAQAHAAERNWNTFIRVSRHQFIGLAHFRHLEDNDPDTALTPSSLTLVNPPTSPTPNDAGDIDG